MVRAQNSVCGGERKIQIVRAVEDNRGGGFIGLPRNRFPAETVRDADVGNDGREQIGERCGGPRSRWSEVLVGRFDRVALANL